MKNISEMQLEDIRAACRRLDMLDDAGSIDWFDSDGIFGSFGQFLILCNLKLKFLLVLRERDVAGIPLKEDIFSLSDFKGKTEEELTDDPEGIYECWRLADEQMERLYISVMEDAGFQLCDSWAAQSEIQEWLGDGNDSGMYDMPLDNRVGEGVDTQTYIRKHFEKYFFEYDKQQQLTDAHTFASINSYDTCLCEYILSFRNIRIGRIFSYIRKNGIEDPAVAVLMDLLDVAANPLYRYIRDFSHSFVSAEDSAYVVRVARGRFLETGEEIDFALFRPVVLMYLPLITRLCTLLEEQYPQILTKEVHDTHEKRCA